MASQILSPSCLPTQSNNLFTCETEIQQAQFLKIPFNIQEHKDFESAFQMEKVREREKKVLNFN